MIASLTATHFAIVTSVLTDSTGSLTMLPSASLAGEIRQDTGIPTSPDRSPVKLCRLFGLSLFYSEWDSWRTLEGKGKNCVRGRRNAIPQYYLRPKTTNTRWQAFCLIPHVFADRDSTIRIHFLCGVLSRRENSWMSWHNFPNPLDAYLEAFPQLWNCH